MNWPTILILIASVALAQDHPAGDFDGVWAGRITLKAPGIPELARDLTLTLKTAGTSVTGTLALERDGPRDSREISDGKIRGNAVRSPSRAGCSIFHAWTSRSGEMGTI
jgi:hypothetical protein